MRREKVGPADLEDAASLTAKPVQTAPWPKAKAPTLENKRRDEGAKKVPDHLWLPGSKPAKLRVSAAATVRLMIKVLS